MSRRTGTILLGLAALAALWLAWCVYFLPKGLDFTDEGLYCSDAWRFANGDVPFRDSLTGSGLSFWYLSWVFRVFPSCGLLGLRVAWAIVLFLCACVTALILVRYFSVFSSFAGATLGLLFASAGTMKVLNYNTMPVLWLLLAVWLWLSACRQAGRLQAVLAAGAGAAAFIATTCRISLVLVVLLPVASILYDALRHTRTGVRAKAVGVFLGSYGAGVFCFVMWLLTAGLLEDFFVSLGLTTAVPGHSFSDLIVFLGVSLVYYLLPGFAMLSVYGLVHLRRLWPAIGHRREVLWRARAVFGFLLVITGLLVGTSESYSNIVVRAAHLLIRGVRQFSLEFYYPPSFYTVHLLLAIAIGLLLLAFFLHVIRSQESSQHPSGNDVHKLGFLAISCSLLMIPGTAAVPAWSVLAMAFLPLGLAFCWCWTWTFRRWRCPTHDAVTWGTRLALVLACAVCLLYAIAPSMYPYRDGFAPRLDGAPMTPKLNGIATTSERASVVDQMVEAVVARSKPGDRILAYENLPMMYFLTDRLPSTHHTWISENMPRTFRQYNLEDMIERDRLPAVVVRATHTARNRYWPESRTPLGWTGDQQLNDPLDAYVREHYQVVEEVGGFEILLPVE